MQKVQINEQVNVTSIGFRRNLVAYPKSMEFRGITYNFIDAGLRCLVSQGERIAEIFTLSDGDTDYRLKRENKDGNWMLLSIVS